MPPAAPRYKTHYKGVAIRARAPGKVRRDQGTLNPGPGPPREARTGRGKELFMLNPVFIDATTLSDAWYQTLYRCVEHGRDFVIDRGSYAGQKRLEFDYLVIRIRMPGARPLLPQVPEHYPFPDPVEQDYLDEYLPYLMTGELKEGESYTYGQRICRYPVPSEWVTNFDAPQLREIVVQEPQAWEIIERESGPEQRFFIDQIKLAIWTYKNKGHRNNQMVLQVAQPNDMLLIDPPCLRHIDTRIQDNMLHFFPYFRSWDLWGGFPANLGAIQLLKEYMAAEIGVADGEIIAASKGLHLYDYVWELAEFLRGKTIEEFREPSAG